MYLRRDGLGSVLLIKNPVTGACGVAAGGVPCATGGYQIPRCGFPRGPACMRPLTPCSTPLPVLPVALRERVPYPVMYAPAAPGVSMCSNCSFPSPSASTVAASYVTGVAGLGSRGGLGQLGIPIDVGPAPTNTDGSTDFCYEVKSIYDAKIRGRAREYVRAATREKLISLLTAPSGIMSYFTAVGWLGPTFASPVSKIGAANVADCLMRIR